MYSPVRPSWDLSPASLTQPTTQPDSTGKEYGRAVGTLCQGCVNVTSTVANPSGGSTTDARPSLIGNSSAAGRAAALINAWSCAAVGYFGEPIRAYSSAALP